MEYSLSKHARDVMVAREIRESWLASVLRHPLRKDVVSDNEVHFFGVISEREGRCLKVVFNPVLQKVVTVYFDRKMRKKGCK